LVIGKDSYVMIGISAFQSDNKSFLKLIKRRKICKKELIIWIFY